MFSPTSMSVFSRRHRPTDLLASTEHSFVPPPHHQHQFTVDNLQHNPQINSYMPHRHHQTVGLHKFIYIRTHRKKRGERNLEEEAKESSAVRTTDMVARAIPYP